MIQMKKMAAAVAIAAASMGGAQAATTLAAGDILFSGWNQAAGVYGYSFTSFVDIAAGTDIYFTDIGWKGAAATNGGWNNSTTIEGLYKWTTGTALTAGATLFAGLYQPTASGANFMPTGVYDSASWGANTGLCSTASCNFTGSINGSLTVLTGNKTNTGTNATTSATAIGSSDAFYIFQGATQAGTTSTGTAIVVPNVSTLLAVGAVTVGGITGDNVTTLGGSTTLTTTALDGTGITLAQSADANAGAKKTVVYTGTRDFSGFADYASSVAAAKAALLDTSNYAFGTDASTSLPLYAAASQQAINTTDFILVAVPEASTYAMLLAGLGMIGLMARRRTQA